MKKIILLFMFGYTSLYSQEIGNGLSPVLTDFSAVNKSGVYTGLPNVNGSVPSGSYQHLFIIRHGNTTNNYQFQIGTSIGENDNVYFRKISSGSLTSVNPSWIEFADPAPYNSDNRLRRLKK